MNTTPFFRKAVLCAVACASCATLTQAQPAARRAQKETQQSTVQKLAVEGREFPTAQEMPADASWRRDVYRSLDLNKDANATLYFPTMPQGGRMNLFTYLFKLVLQGKVKAYEYTLDGNEHFDAKHQMKPTKIMDTYEIYYEKVDKDGKTSIRLNDADLPSEAVKLYFIKESSYYDQHTASFRTKVTAICPVLQRGDSEFGGSELRNPMFWVNYEEAAPYLSKLELMGSNLNNAATVSADDYFTTNRYEGEIYKVTNLQDKILANYCPTDSAMTKEQKRIEKELADFRRHVWGHDSIPADTTLTDSLAETDAKSANRTTRAAASRKRDRSASVKSSSSKSSKPAKSKAPKSSKSSASGSKLSVRRQRH
ncbi:MAG: gliding motility protein GldN [Bacteroidaceae bacterium]|nr:gliding motility protein GldN [Bacteroidaceae bacterium]